MASVQHGPEHYYVPESSPWPIVAMVSALLIVFGLALWINGITVGSYISIGGFILLGVMFYGWFRDVVRENLANVYNEQVGRSFRQGMFWFIASEVFFFLSFFGALFYLRFIAMSWMGGEGYLAMTHELLYSGFEAVWPSAGPEPTAGEFTPMGAWGIPALNTAILLSSGATLTWAHWALKKDDQKQLIWGLVATVVLGLIFVGFQAYEYVHAYRDLNLTLEQGIYGSTFFMLTGFHGFHVIVGAIMLLAVLGRAVKGHFSPHNHFAFEAAAWYWHFVDVVWLALFIFVYWM
ncbi:cytochrome c oxidase subunit 3 [Thioalkalivibrio denitrificans]|uniref:cytochrome-c oxidase n=1 Tax=Thioalkalivibrio denitrificans TaxID=108003 RepID=A0A1V3NDH1_9GAMM|nr:cytochrome c oxidase subunit 3 [Thioalkalivibrio denitrificans]OOG23091.1 cytochrome c oxidase subunit 3 [Thioalkalivibrio denitrificans]